MADKKGLGLLKYQLNNLYYFERYILGIWR